MVTYGLINKWFVFEFSTSYLDLAAIPITQLVAV